MFGFSGITAWIGGVLLVALLAASGAVYYLSGRVDTLKQEKATLQDSLDGLNKAVEERIAKEKQLSDISGQLEKQLAAARAETAKLKKERDNETSKPEYSCVVPSGGWRLLRENADRITATANPR